MRLRKHEVKHPPHIVGDFAALAAQRYPNEDLIAHNTDLLHRRRRPHQTTIKTTELPWCLVSVFGVS